MFSGNFRLIICALSAVVVVVAGPVHHPEEPQFAGPRKTLAQEIGSPSDLAWQAWLLVEDQPGSPGALDSSNILRRITPKSIFIAPEIASCAAGYTADSKGVCQPDPVKIDADAQKLFYLNRLNLLANKAGWNKKKPSSSGPLQVNIPISLPQPQIQPEPVRVNVTLMLGDDDSLTSYKVDSSNDTQLNTQNNSNKSMVHVVPIGEILDYHDSGKNDSSQPTLVLLLGPTTKAPPQQEENNFSSQIFRSTPEPWVPVSEAEIPTVAPLENHSSTTTVEEEAEEEEEEEDESYGEDQTEPDYNDETTEDPEDELLKPGEAGSMVESGAKATSTTSTTEEAETTTILEETDDEVPPSTAKIIEEQDEIIATTDVVTNLPSTTEIATTTNPDDTRPFRTKMTPPTPEIVTPTVTIPTTSLAPIIVTPEAPKVNLIKLEEILPKTEKPRPNIKPSVIFNTKDDEDAIPADFRDQIAESSKQNLRVSSSPIKFPTEGKDSKPSKGFVKFPSDEVNSIHNLDFKDRYGSFRSSTSQKSLPQWRIDRKPQRNFEVTRSNSQLVAQQQRQKPKPMLLRFWARMPLVPDKTLFPPPASQEPKNYKEDAPNHELDRLLMARFGG